MSDDKAPTNTTEPNGLFELRLIGKLAPDRPKPAVENQASIQQRHDQETGRRLATQFAEEALYNLVNIMRNSKDEKMVISASEKIMNRAWGQTKALTEDEKKGADAGSILDVLAAVSHTMSAAERQERELGKIQQERDAKGIGVINTDEEATKFLSDLNKGLDISDGEIIE